MVGRDLMVGHQTSESCHQQKPSNIVVAIETKVNFWRPITFLVFWIKHVNRTLRKFTLYMETAIGFIQKKLTNFLHRLDAKLD